MAETEVLQNKPQNSAINPESAQAIAPEDAGLTSEERIEEEKFAILSNKVSYIVHFLDGVNGLIMDRTKIHTGISKLIYLLHFYPYNFKITINPPKATQCIC